MGAFDGDWQIDIEFVHGRARHAVHLVQAGDDLTGRYRSRYGEHEVSGHVDGNRVDLRVSIHHEHAGARYGFEGELANGVISGAVDLGEYWSGAWKATRPG